MDENRDKNSELDFGEKTVNLGEVVLGNNEVVEEEETVFLGYGKKNDRSQSSKLDETKTKQNLPYQSEEKQNDAKQRGENHFAKKKVVLGIISIVIFVLIAVAFWLGSDTSPKNNIVTFSTEDSIHEIQERIQNRKKGDIFCFSAGTYHFDAPLYISDDVCIMGEESKDGVPELSFSRNKSGIISHGGKIENISISVEGIVASSIVVFGNTEIKDCFLESEYASILVKRGESRIESCQLVSDKYGIYMDAIDNTTKIGIWDSGICVGETGIEGSLENTEIINTTIKEGQN